MSRAASKSATSASSRTAVADAEHDRLGAFLRDSGEAAFAEGFFRGIPPFFETRLGDDCSGEFLFQRVASHAAAVAFEEVDDERERVGLHQAAEFFELLDFFRPEIVGADPLGLLERELQLHRLSGGLFEIDGDLFGREIPVDHLAGTEGFMNTKVSGSQLRKALADRFGNATGFNQFRHVRMHGRKMGSRPGKRKAFP